MLLHDYRYSINLYQVIYTLIRTYRLFRILRIMVGLLYILRPIIIEKYGLLTKLTLWLGKNQKCVSFLGLSFKQKAADR